MIANRKSREDVRVFSKRRQELAQLMKGSVLVLGSPPEFVRNRSVMHSFRPESSFYYLTGYEEPESIFVFRPGMTPETILFTRHKDPTKELWDGFRFGPEAAKQEFKFDQTFVLSEFPTQMPLLLAGAERLHYRRALNSNWDIWMDQALLQHQRSSGRSGQALLSVHDPDAILGELRVKKMDADLMNLRRACQITAEAHMEVMKICRPGKTERELHGKFISEIMKRGADREGYNGIFASGANACTLHYVYNDQILKAGDFLLVDAAGEFNFFTSDITRTYPITGSFTPPQRELYEAVLRVQKQIIESVKVGVSFEELQQQTAEELTREMMELGFFTGRFEDVLAAKEYRKYFPHRVGHYLGMDVHDVGRYSDADSKPRGLEAGMVLTIEPGIYVPWDDQQAPQQYRGLGIRIEDDILVTSGGRENLTSSCIKDVADLEAIIGRGQ